MEVTLSSLSCPLPWLLSLPSRLDPSTKILPTYFRLPAAWACYLLPRFFVRCLDPCLRLSRAACSFLLLPGSFSGLLGASLDVAWLSRLDAELPRKFSGCSIAARKFLGTLPVARMLIMPLWLMRLVVGQLLQLPMCFLWRLDMQPSFLVVDDLYLLWRLPQLCWLATVAADEFSLLPLGLHSCRTFATVDLLL